MSDRKYPDIDFVETDTETIESNLIALYENFVQQVPGRERYKVYPASPERLFISWVANINVKCYRFRCRYRHFVCKWSNVRSVQGVFNLFQYPGRCLLSILQKHPDVYNARFWACHCHVCHGW